MVDAPEERRLAGPRRPEDAHDLAFLHLQGHAAEDAVLPEVLLDVLRLDDHRAPRADVHWLPSRRSTQLSSSGRSLTPSLRSICTWISPHTVVSTRYQNATATKYSTGLNVTEYPCSA